MDETLKQVFYKATTNAEFGKYFSQLPLSQDYFSDNVDLAKYIQRHYYKNDSPVSMSSLLIEIIMFFEKYHYDYGLYLHIV